ncbi:hypothetical protein I532_19337 [Brevibacillus borstelensis AK1]|uniref:Uncharacterized protein n=1 Tax=Brevibacillus borstelensis AK1 TaxID=1300222 RepID=M8DCM5_9BACL|nr:hypothetical protein I532_19337 [Brevibacillus borstelensis AK1]
MGSVVRAAVAEMKQEKKAPGSVGHLLGSLYCPAPFQKGNRVQKQPARGCVSEVGREKRVPLFPFLLGRCPKDLRLFLLFHLYSDCFRPVFLKAKDKKAFASMNLSSLQRLKGSL